MCIGGSFTYEESIKSMKDDTTRMSLIVCIVLTVAIYCMYNSYHTSTPSTSSPNDAIPEFDRYLPKGLHCSQPHPEVLSTPSLQPLLIDVKELLLLQEEAPIESF